MDGVWGSGGTGFALGGEPEVEAEEDEKRRASSGSLDSVGGEGGLGAVGWRRVRTRRCPAILVALG
jgi:hypothetical protein